MGELERLRAVVTAVQAEVTKPGAVTKTELRAALATPDPGGPPRADDDYADADYPPPDFA